jgi:hypothetical protein
MQEQFLQQIFKHALHCARQFGSEAASAAPGSEAAAASGAAAAAAMKLMTSVLAWDWKASNSSLGFMSATLAGLTSAMVRAAAQPGGISGRHVCIRCGSTTSCFHP